MYLSRLRSVLDQARDDGVASMRIGRQQVVTALSAWGRSDRPPLGLTLERWEELRDRAGRKAELSQSTQHLRGVRADGLVRDAHLAPFTIYPLPSALAAALTTDIMGFEYVVGWDRIAEAMCARGFEVSCSLPEASGVVNHDQPVFICRLGDAQLVIYTFAIDQVLLELVDIDRYAAAMKEVV